MHKPNPTAIYYSKEKTRYDYPSKRYISREGENGTLWSMGTHPTKIRVKDLPDHYIYVYLYGSWKFLSSKGVKYMYYIPNNWVNHFLKDDVLYISYNKPLEIKTGRWGNETCDNYDIALFGNSILDFVAAAKYYSGYDTAGIEEAIKKKLALFRELHPEDAKWTVKDWEYNPEEYDKKVREHKLWRGT